MTSQSDPEAALAGAIAAHFGLGTAAGPMTSVDRGVMGQVWLLRTDSGRWAVKSPFGESNPEGARIDVRLQEAAVAAGVSLPRPVPGIDGQYVAANAIDTAYRRGVSTPVDVDLGIFTAAIGSWLNFTAGTVANALEDDDPDHQEFLLMNLSRLLGQPLSRDVLDQILAAVE